MVIGYCAEAATLIREHGGNGSLYDIHKVLEKLPDEFLFAALKEITLNNNYRADYPLLSSSLIRPVHSTNIINLILDKYQVRNVKAISLCTEAIDIDN